MMFVEGYTLPQASEFISIRLDGELKTELQQAAELERRSLSNFCRLLLEYSWGEYLKAGSMRNLVERIQQTPDRSQTQQWPFKP
jgi:hypothetical protein